MAYKKRKKNKREKAKENKTQKTMDSFLGSNPKINKFNNDLNKAIEKTQRSINV